MLAAWFRGRPGRSWGVAALVLAALSLPFGHALAFDASAWVVWGREVVHLDLQTGAGPSWKPFPVLFTAPLSVLGDGAAAGWLVVARAGALLAVVGAARLSARAAGPWAVPVAAATLVLSPWWLLNGALGNADPILGALVVWALLAAGEGRERTAFWLVVAGALIRPEVWPFLALLALLLLRRGTVPLAHALGAGVGVLVLWVVPDALSSGLASTSGATGTASAGSAGLTAFPFGTVLVDLGRQAPWVGLAAALLAVALTQAPRASAGTAVRVPVALRPALWLALALAYALLVAVMAQAGFAGNPRYLVPALVLLAAVTGTVVGVGGTARAGGADGGVAGGAAGAERRVLGVPVPPVIAAVVVLVLVASGAGGVRDQVDGLRERAAVRRGLFSAVDAASGPDRVRAGAPVRSADPGLRALVAEALHESVPAATARPRPGDAVARRAPDGRWTLR